MVPRTVPGGTYRFICPPNEKADSPTVFESETPPVFELRALTRRQRSAIALQFGYLKEEHDAPATGRGPRTSARDLNELIYDTLAEHVVRIVQAPDGRPEVTGEAVQSVTDDLDADRALQVFLQIVHGGEIDSVGKVSSGTASNGATSPAAPATSDTPSG